jgi:hypothetical protein
MSMHNGNPREQFKVKIEQAFKYTAPDVRLGSINFK